MKTEDRIKYLKGVSFIITMTGVMVCLGWFLDIKIFKALVPGYASMRFNTAIVFILLGASFYLVIINKWKIIFRLLCLSALAISLASLLQYAFDFNFGIDEWVVKDDEAVLSLYPYPGRPSQTTLISFICIGIGFLMVRSKARRVRIVGQYFFHIVTVLSFISLLGYLFNVPTFYKLSFITSVALHTAVGFLILSVSATLINPNLGVTHLFTGRTMGNIVAQRLFPRMFIVLLLLGFVCIVAQRNHIISEEFSIALYTAVCIVVTLFLIWNTSARLDEINKQRIAAENNINKLNQELEEKVLQRTEELAEINKEMESFTYSVSHDLRGPLRSIGGYASMLEEDCGKDLDEAGKLYLTLISKTTLKMGTLIENLLAFSRLGKQPISKAEVNMQALVEEVWEELLWLRDYKGQINIHPLPTLQADRAMLKQALVNLMSNALKYTTKTENPVIEIGVERQENEFIFYIKDNGAGFDMKYINKLFGVFERLHSESEFEGTGVGLAIVKRVITKHGGRIWAEAEPNKGACFYFSLPK